MNRLLQNLYYIRELLRYSARILMYWRGHFDSARRIFSLCSEVPGSSNEFKPLLLKIAALAAKDQRWLLKQLTPQHKGLFDKHKGEQLLNEARRFIHIPCPKPTTVSCSLPSFAPELNAHPPLYVAILLEQGQFVWENEFLKGYFYQNEVSVLTTTTLRELKPATKAAVFAQWQKTLSFAEQLELDHGPNH